MCDCKKEFTADPNGWTEHDCGPTTWVSAGIHHREIGALKVQLEESHRVERKLTENNLRLRERLEVAHEQERRLGDENIKLNRRVHMLEERLIASGNKISEMKSAIACSPTIEKWCPVEDEVISTRENLIQSGYIDEARVLNLLWRALEQATRDAVVNEDIKNKWLCDRHEKEDAK